MTSSCLAKYHQVTYLLTITTISKLYTKDRAKHRQLKRVQQNSQKVLGGILLLLSYSCLCERFRNCFFFHDLDLAKLYEFRQLFIAYPHIVDCIAEQELSQCHNDKVACVLGDASNIVGDVNSKTFKGGFEQSAINNSVPQIILNLVDMMIRGPSIDLLISQSMRVRILENLLFFQ